LNKIPRLNVIRQFLEGADTKWLARYYSVNEYEINDIIRDTIKGFYDAQRTTQTEDTNTDGRPKPTRCTVGDVIERLSRDDAGWSVERSGPDQTGGKG